MNEYVFNFTKVIKDITNTIYIVVGICERLPKP